MSRPKLLVLGLLSALLAIPSWALAQGKDESASGDSRSAAGATSDSWKQRRFHVGGFGGRLLGGTALGSTENLFFRATYNTDHGSLAGGRLGWVFAPRFDLELEIGTTQPDITATLTTLQGRDKTEIFFADLRLTYVMGVVNYSMVDRMNRVAPYLTLGAGWVRASSDIEDILSSRKVGIIFGVGTRVRVVDSLALRADLRGLRSGFSSKQDTDALPKILMGDYNASHLLWSVGLEFSF